MALLTIPIPFFPFRVVQEKHLPSMRIELGRQTQPGSFRLGTHTKDESTQTQVLPTTSAAAGFDPFLMLLQGTQRPVFLSMYEFGSGH